MDYNDVIELYNSSKLIKLENITDIGEVEMNNGHGTLFIKPKDKKFLRIEVSFDGTKLTKVTYLGDIGLTHENLETFFGKARIHYSIYDQERFYFFSHNGKEFLQIIGSDELQTRLTFINM